jgi:hypothetical protein
MLRTFLPGKQSGTIEPSVPSSIRDMLGGLYHEFDSRGEILQSWLARLNN